MLNLPGTMETVKSIASAVGIQFQDRFIPILVSAIMIGGLAYYGFERIGKLEDTIAAQSKKIVDLESEMQTDGGNRISLLEEQTASLGAEIGELKSELDWTDEGSDRLADFDNKIEFSTESIYNIAKHFKDVPDGYWVTSINFEEKDDDIIFKLPISIKHHVSMSIFHSGISEQLIGHRLKVDINKKDFEFVKLYLDPEPRELATKDFFIDNRQYQEFRVSLDPDTTEQELQRFRGNPLSVLVVVRRPVTIPSLVADND